MTEKLLEVQRYLLEGHCDRKMTYIDGARTTPRSERTLFRLKIYLDMQVKKTRGFREYLGRKRVLVLHSTHIEQAIFLFKQPSCRSFTRVYPR